MHIPLSELDNKLGSDLTHGSSHLWETGDNKQLSKQALTRGFNQDGWLVSIALRADAGEQTCSSRLSSSVHTKQIIFGAKRGRMCPIPPNKAGELEGCWDMRDCLPIDGFSEGARKFEHGVPGRRRF